MKKTEKAKNPIWKIKKYYRRMRLYLKRVKRVEREMGGEIFPC